MNLQFWQDSFRTLNFCPTQSPGGAWKLRAGIIWRFLFTHVSGGWHWKDSNYWRLEQLELLGYLHLFKSSTCLLCSQTFYGSQISHIPTQSSQDMCLKRGKQAETELPFPIQPLEVILLLVQHMRSESWRLPRFKGREIRLQFLWGEH